MGKGKELCVLVHGFTGSPAEVEPLGKRLTELGYDVVCPTLAGHDATKDDLRKATTSAWIQSVQPIVDEGLKQGVSVHLIGFSMGALICAWVASRTPVSSLTMMAPAIYYVSPTLMFRQMAAFIKQAWHRGQINPEFVRDRLDRLNTTPLVSVRQFRRMVQMAKSVFQTIQVPVCIIQGDLDEIVEPRGASLVYDEIGSTNKQVHYLPESGHMVCLDVESDVVAELVTSFLDSCRNLG